MSAGLFGKLPAKRDFVAANAPRRFLEVWEPWLQAGVATSKQILGPKWADAYNRAPIWRYWLGADFCGEATIGVFMPSVDGVGRSFPLSLFAGEGESSLLPPELELNDAWFEAAEAILLDALDPAATLEDYRRPGGFDARAGAASANGRGRRPAGTVRRRDRHPRRRTARFLWLSSRRDGSAIGGPLRPSPSGGRSAARVSRPSRCPTSACRRQIDLSRC